MNIRELRAAGVGAILDWTPTGNAAGLGKMKVNYRGMGLDPNSSKMMACVVPVTGGMQLYVEPSELSGEFLKIPLDTGIPDGKFPMSPPGDEPSTRPGVDRGENQS